MSSNENYKVIFRKTGKDDHGRVRHDFEVKLENRPYSVFDFALSENGERIVMGNKHFHGLPRSLQNEIAANARKLIPR